MLRLLDARSRSYVVIQPARAGLLRVCAHAPETSQRADLTGLRVLLVADLLARAAELRNLQVLIVVTFAGQLPGQLTDFEQAAGALGMHSPQARARHDDAQAALDGPIDVHLVSGRAPAEGALEGLAVPVGVAGVEPRGHDSLRSHPLAARFALLSVPYYEPADLADGQLTEAADTEDAGGVRWPNGLSCRHDRWRLTPRPRFGPPSMTSTRCTRSRCCATCPSTPTRPRAPSSRPSSTPTASSAWTCPVR